MSNTLILLCYLAIFIVPIVFYLVVEYFLYHPLLNDNKPFSILEIFKRADVLLWGGYAIFVVVTIIIFSPLLLKEKKVDWILGHSIYQYINENDPEEYQALRQSIIDSSTTPTYGRHGTRYKVDITRDKTLSIARLYIYKKYNLNLFDLTEEQLIAIVRKNHIKNSRYAFVNSCTTKIEYWNNKWVEDAALNKEARKIENEHKANINAVKSTVAQDNKRDFLYEKNMRKWEPLSSTSMSIVIKAKQLGNRLNSYRYRSESEQESPNPCEVYVQLIDQLFELEKKEAAMAFRIIYQ